MKSQNDDILLIKKESLFEHNSRKLANLIGAGDETDYYSYYCYKDNTLFTKSKCIRILTIIYEQN